MCTGASVERGGDGGSLVTKHARLGLLSLIAALVLAPTSSALAGYPPTLHLCADLAGEAGQNGGRLVLEVEGVFRIEGGPGCANPGSQGHVDGQSHRFTFTGSNFVAAADGSYASPTLRLPAHMTAGPHSLFSVFPEGEVMLPILVVSSGGSGDTNDPDTNNTTGSPTGSNQSLGGGGGLATTAKRAAGGGGGILPKTGAGILTLILWAIALIAVGTWLVIAARRRLEWHRLQAGGSRSRSHDPYPRALPMPEVPFFDTRGYSHVRPAVPPPTSNDPAF